MAGYPLSINHRVGLMEAAGGIGRPAIGGMTLAEYDDILFGVSDGPVDFDSEGFSQNLANDARSELRRFNSTLKERREASAALRDQRTAEREALRKSQPGWDAGMNL